MVMCMGNDFFFKCIFCVTESRLHPSDDKAAPSPAPIPPVAEVLPLSCESLCPHATTVESINNDNCNNENTVVTRHFSNPIFYPS